VGRFAIPAGQRAQRIVRKIGTVNYGAGSNPGLPGGVPKSGYITEFDLRSSMQVVTGATAPVVAGYGPYGLQNLIQVLSGNRLPFSAYPFAANAFFETFDPPYKDILAANPVVTSSTNNWVDDLRIPLTVSPDSEIGAWYAGDVELNMDVQLGGAATTQAFSTVNGATIQGSHDVYVERFTAPAPDAPGGWLNEISFFTEFKRFGTFTLKNGETVIDLDRDRDYLRLMLVFYTGSTNDSTFAPADALYTTLELQIDDNFSVYFPTDEATTKKRMLNDYQWSVAGSGTKILRPGIAMLDFMVEKHMSRRDVLPADAKLIQSIKLRVVSTSASNILDVFTHTAYDNPFAVKYIQAVQAQSKGRGLIPAGR
jgi:hypothetical protein